MPKGIPNAKAEELPETAAPVGYGGIERAQQTMTTAGRWPMLKVEDAARARFHFLTTGGDEWFCGTRFHKVSIGGDQFREVLCLRALTQGLEACELDAQQAGEKLLNRFGCWVYVHHILHPHDNKDEAADSWPQVQVKTAAGGQRVMFKETVEEARYLRLSAGRSQVVFAQFTNAWMVSGNLRKHIYELHRMGEALETTYVLTPLKEEMISEDVLQNEDIQSLPSIESIFRESLFYSGGAVPSSDGVLGSDSLDESLPAIEEEASPAIEDDLI